MKITKIKLDLTIELEEQLIKTFIQKWALKKKKWDHSSYSKQ